MNKMSVVGLLVLIATLPACDYCCVSHKKAEAPVEAVVVQEADIAEAPAVVDLEEATLEDVAMPEDNATPSEKI